MLKENITARDVCNLLNELLKLDYDCISRLVSHREPCNKAVAEHPTVQVQQYIDDKTPKVGLIGIINGVFGIRDDGMGSICYEVEESTNRIEGFKTTPEKK